MLQFGRERVSASILEEAPTHVPSGMLDTTTRGTEALRRSKSTVVGTRLGLGRSQPRMPRANQLAPARPLACAPRRLQVRSLGAGLVSDIPGVRPNPWAQQVEPADFAAA